MQERENWDSVDGIDAMENRAYELLELMRARKSFAEYVPFITRSTDRLVLSRFHHLICETLQKVADGEIKRLIINMPPRHGKPLCVNTFINERTRGRVRLSEICVGDEVLTHRGRFRRVLAVHEQGILPLLRITTHKGRSVRAAPDHPFLTPRGWIAAGDLLTTDILASVLCGGRLNPDPIISIEPAGEGECRCLTIDEDGTFTADDIVVHNSTLATGLFPSWLLGHHPRWQFLVASADMDLAMEFSKRVQDYVRSDDYRLVFPEVEVASDSQAAGKWRTNKGGIYRAFGAGSGSAGRGANLAIVDDPIGKREQAFSPTVREKIWKWFGDDIYSRLEPDAALILIHTRWHEDDPGGRLIRAMRQGRETWMVLSLPAICESEDSDTERWLGRKKGDPLWPEKFDLKALTRIRDESAISKTGWSALYQQNPLPEGSVILPREHWKLWKGNKDAVGAYDHRRPSNISKIVLSIDTAFKPKMENDYSACTVWGVFTPPKPRELPWKDTMRLIREQDRSEPHVQQSFSSIDPRDMDIMAEFRIDFNTLRRIQEGEDVPEPSKPDGFDISFSGSDVKPSWERRMPYNVILMDAWHDRLRYPDLRRKVLETIMKWGPDDILIEDTSAGISLIQEFRRAGIKVHSHNPGLEHKETRAHMVSGILEAGVVHAMTGWKRHPDGKRELVLLPACDEVIGECERFPAGANDDYVDTVVQLLHYLRNLGAFSIASDKGYGEDSYDAPRQRRRVSPYA